MYSLWRVSYSFSCRVVYRSTRLVSPISGLLHMFGISYSGGLLTHLRAVSSVLWAGFESFTQQTVLPSSLNQNISNK